MPEPFQQLKPDEFAALVLRYGFARKITSVHVHHTWRPRAAAFRGIQTLQSIRNYHVKQMGWSDIAQHVTIDPSGTIWTGRDWNQPPVSARGFNGNRTAGPFMLEMIGDFDQGQESLSEAQLQAAALVTAAIHHRFRLGSDEFRFHNEMSAKTCPGSALTREDFRAAVEAFRARLEEPAAALGATEWANRDAGRLAQDVDGILSRMPRANGARQQDSAESNAEPGEEEMTLLEIALLEGDSGSGSLDASSRGADGRGQDIPPALLDVLAPHVVNLRQGRFSSDGMLQTSRGDVEALVEGIGRWVESRPAAAPVVLFAHGGLVSEESGIGIVQKHVSWWTLNGVYPVYFAWETGFCETLGQLLSASSERGLSSARALDLKDLTDPIVERLARKLRGPAIWGSMKRSAERAFDQEGKRENGRYLLDGLAALCREHPGKIELHAVGHSAGSIFHTHLLQAWSKMAGVPAFKSLQLLAPAVSADLFLDLVEPLIGPDLPVEHATLFTMKKHEELADSCMGLYGKSLLYLIYHALDDRPESDVVGLEISLRARARLKELFGLATPSRRGEAVLSPTPEGSERTRAASNARQHGAFDDNGWTMTSVLCRVLGRDPEQLKARYPGTDGARGPLGDCLSDIMRWRGTAAVAFPSPPGPAYAVPSAPPPLAAVAVPGGNGLGGSGRRRALCVGINAYPTMPLAGCVRDAEEWAAFLRESLRFEPPTMLLDAQATHAGIVQALERLVSESRAGDVLVFQYSGHGTRVPDYDGDEPEGRDEALCPYDIAEGAFLVDDDVRRVLQRLPDGASLTCFIDCCHSGSITRFAVGVPTNARASTSHRRARFLLPTEAMIEAHRIFRGQAASGARTAPPSPGGQEAMRHVVFAACRDDEVAYEEDGQGEFTVRALRVLRRGADGYTNAAFAQAVTDAFGQDPRQHVTLDCAKAARAAALLGTVLAPAAGRRWSDRWQRGGMSAGLRLEDRR